MVHDDVSVNSSSHIRWWSHEMTSSSDISNFVHTSMVYKGHMMKKLPKSRFLRIRAIQVTHDCT